jgi:hypothetical protein
MPRERNHQLAVHFDSADHFFYFTNLRCTTIDRNEVRSVRRDAKDLERKAKRPLKYTAYRAATFVDYNRWARTIRLCRR